MKMEKICNCESAEKNFYFGDANFTLKLYIQLIIFEPSEI